MSDLGRGSGDCGMIVGFSGSSRPIPEVQRDAIRTTLLRLHAQGAMMLHHGDCVNADEAAHDLWVREIGGMVTVHRHWTPGDEHGALTQT